MFPIFLSSFSPCKLLIMIDNFFDFLTLTPNIPINSLHLKNVVRIAYILNIILSYLLFFLLFVLIENRLSDNNIWQWLITFRGKEIKSITIRFFHVLQNTRNSYETSSQEYTHIYIHLYTDKTNYITNSPPIKYYPALLRISFDPNAKI